MRRLLPLLLVIMAVGAYAGLLSASDLEFVFDDARFIRDNPAIRDLGALPDFFTDPRTVDLDGWAGIYRPLRTLDFAIDWAIAGPTKPPAGTGTVRWFHLRNVLYHAAATLLLYLLFGQWGARERQAALGALVFALHPVQTEAVAWISSRADVMSLVLILAALYAHSRATRLDRHVAIAAGFLFLGLLAKEAAVVFVGLVVLSDFMIRDRARIRETLRRWPAYLVYAAVVGAYILLWLNRHFAQGETGLAGGGVFDQLTVERFVTIARSFVYYARLTLLPVDLAQDYYLPETAALNLTTIVCALLVLGAAIWSVYRIFRNGSRLAFALLWFLIAIFPTTSLLMPLGVATADRFLYLPLVGFAFFAGRLLDRLANQTVIGRVLVGAALGCLFLLTFARAQVWADADALWNSTTRYFSPRATEWFAERKRERAEELIEQEIRLRDRGRSNEADELRAEADELLLSAIDDLNVAIRFWERASPRWEPVLISISLQSVCLYHLRRYDDALERAEFCLQKWPDMELGHYARSLALLGVGRVREAAAAIDRALSLKPRPNYREAGARIYERLAEHYERRGNQAQVCLALRRSFSLFPSEEENGEVAQKLNRLEREYQALVARFEEELRQDPKNGDARLRLACAHAAFGYYELAGPIFENLLSLDQVGRHPLILGPYALYFWQSRDTVEGYERAISIYREILAMDPEREDVRQQLEACEAALAELRQGDN